MPPDRPPTPYADHPNFPQPDDGARIWRYCDLQQLISLLSRKALYFPRLTSLDDPYEAKWTRALAERFPQFNGSIYEYTRHQLFVNCWHLNEFESAAMWQLYARMNEGVAIRSSVKGLKSALTSFAQVPKELLLPDISPQVYIGKVTYLDYEKEMFDISNMFIAALHKRRSFEHERELRAVCWLSNNYLEWMPTPGPYYDGIFVNCDLDILIEEVVISPTAPEVFREAVRAVCGSFGLDRPVTQSDLASGPLY